MLRIIFNVFMSLFFSSGLVCTPAEHLGKKWILGSVDHMKKYFLLILLCFFGNICLAQNFAKTFAAQEFLTCGDDLFLNKDS